MLARSIVSLFLRLYFSEFAPCLFSGLILSVCKVVVVPPLVLCPFRVADAERQRRILTLISPSVFGNLKSCGRLFFGVNIDVGVK